MALPDCNGCVSNCLFLLRIETYHCSFVPERGCNAKDEEAGAIVDVCMKDFKNGLYGC